MKQLLSLLLLSFCAVLPLYAQLSISTKNVAGVRPYEMKPDMREATIDFTDCSKWILKADGCQAELKESNRQIVTADYSGMVVYRTDRKKASIYLALAKPIFLKDNWNCLDLWTYADHWFWGEPSFGTAMQLYAVFADKSGNIHEVNWVQSGYTMFAHKYWFLNHLKINERFETFTHFLGIKLKGNNTDVGTRHTLFFSSLYMYKEILKPLIFKPFPENLPFPCRKETILPINKEKKYKNTIIKQNDQYIFTYFTHNTNIQYMIPVSNPLGDISIFLNGRERQKLHHRSLVFENGDTATLTVRKSRVIADTLFLDCRGRHLSKNIDFSVWYTINQKSLVMNIKEKGIYGTVKVLSSGMITKNDDIVTLVPFLKYNNSDRPSVLYQNGLFYMAMFDWYHTNASAVTVVNSRDADYTSGSVIYIPKTNGKLNTLDEKLFITVSEDVQEVLPTIDNPASPMRSAQADRLWAINGGANLDTLAHYVIGLRSRGVEKVTIRYHEGFWRAGGESYTFKLTPNPDLGIEKIRNYVQFVKDQDWRVGLYTNYTDMSPVNSYWNPDWMKQDSKGQWEVSWARCYAPKPQIAWEQEAILAPQIHQLFNTNHSYCDVHTAISPITRVDYDYRVPEAAMMKGVIKRYGLLLMNERKAYDGPVYSEGGNHWWYAGLDDGNYANDDLLKLPVFPDFNLMKIHPLEMDAANTGENYQYICYALAYGNIGILSEDVDAIRRYAFLQPVQNEYVMIPLKSIGYYDGHSFCCSSDAIKKSLLKCPLLRIEYESGFVAYVNFGVRTAEITFDGRSYRLPQYGFFACSADGKIHSSSLVESEEQRCDEVYSPYLYYLNTNGATITKALGGKGNYMLKKEKFGWELIPLSETINFDFDLSLLGLDNVKVKIVLLDKGGKVVNELPFLCQSKVTFSHQPGAYKYMIVPAE
jgi:hypothetical protein